MKETHAGPTLCLREPRLGDGAQIHELVASAPPLEVNSCYAYHLLSTHFSSTCAIAEAEGRMVGFLGAYRPPSRPEALFVWQVVVSEEARGQGLARRLMEEVLSRPSCSGVRFLEASVTPGNESSARLFRGAAAHWGAAWEESAWLEPEHFGSAAHEAEVLFRIGPFDFEQSEKMSEEESTRRNS